MVYDLSGWLYTAALLLGVGLAGYWVGKVRSTMNAARVQHNLMLRWLADVQALQGMLQQGSQEREYARMLAVQLELMLQNTTELLYGSFKDGGAVRGTQAGTGGGANGSGGSRVP